MLINIRSKLLDLNEPKIMGILNFTPDSFFAQSRTSISDCLKKVETFLEHGCDIIDIGAYSSRPGAVDISPEEEWQRLAEPLALIRRTFPTAIISVDSFRASVAERALDMGVDILNDISGGALDEGIWDVVARYQVPYILMHMRGTPQTMQHETEYENLVVDVMQYFAYKIEKLRAKHIKDIILDPGFGFAKTLEQNYILMKNLKSLKIFDLPILVGVSRKAMLYRLLEVDASETLVGTAVLNFYALLSGGHIIRVHDIKQAAQVRRIYRALKQ